MNARPAFVRSKSYISLPDRENIKEDTAMDMSVVATSGFTSAAMVGMIVLLVASAKKQ